MQEGAYRRDEFRILQEALEIYLMKAKDARNSSLNHGTAILLISIGIIGILAAYAGLNLTNFIHMASPDLPLPSRNFLLFMWLVYIVCVLFPLMVAFKINNAFAQAIKETFHQQVTEARKARYIMKEFTDIEEYNKFSQSDNI